MMRIGRFSCFPVRVFLLLPIIILIGWYSPLMLHAGNGYRKLINCAVQTEACTDRIGDMDIRLNITPKPIQAMTDLVFTVVLSGRYEPPVSPPYIDLGMPGMNMGPHRVKIKPIGKNLYEGKGVIVKCPSGHRIWKATVTIPDIGKTEFIFDVIY